MRYYGGEGRIHLFWDRHVALHELAGRLNHRSPVVAFTQAGVHAVTVYGYEAVHGGPITAIYVADPLTGFMGRVPADSWVWSSYWFGARFSTPGPKWQGGFVFVSYNDFRSTASAAPAPAPATRPYASRWLWQSPYPTLTVGAVAELTLVVRNSGTVTWTKGTATEVRIGVKRDSTAFHEAGMAQGWLLPNRPAAQLEPSVPPGGDASFKFLLRGAAPGSYVLELQPVIDGLTWLDDQGIYFSIVVSG
jgi:hypothetical protein